MSRVMIVGGGKVGAYLAELLIEGGHEVTVVEDRADHVSELSSRFGPHVVVHGSGTDAFQLERAGIRSCQVLAVVTGSDETNLVVAALGRFEFGVERVIARVVDPRNAWMFAEDMGVDVALNQADLLAHLIAEEMSLGEMTTLLKLRRGQYSLVEEKVDPQAVAVGRKVGDLGLPQRCVLLAVIRRGDLIDPDSSLELVPGDEVLAVVHADSLLHLATLLGAPPLNPR